VALLATQAKREANQEKHDLFGWKHQECEQNLVSESLPNPRRMKIEEKYGKFAADFIHFSKEIRLHTPY
jgi:hypothetical protein